MRFNLFVSRYVKDNGLSVIRSERIDVDAAGTPKIPLSLTMQDQQVLTPYKLVNDRLRGRRAILRTADNKRHARLLSQRDPNLLLAEIREYEAMPEVICVAYAGEDR